MGPGAAVGSRRQCPARHLTRRFRGGGPRKVVTVFVFFESVTWGFWTGLVVRGGSAGLEPLEGRGVGAVREQVNAGLSDRRGESVWFCSGGFDRGWLGRKRRGASLASEGARGPGSRVKVAHMGGKGIFVPSKEAVLDPLWQLIRVGFRQIADLMLHGVDASQEDRLLLLFSFLKFLN